MLPEIIGVCVYVVGTPDEQVGGVGVKNFVRIAMGTLQYTFTSMSSVYVWRLHLLLSGRHPDVSLRTATRI